MAHAGDPDREVHDLAVEMLVAQHIETKKDVDCPRITRMRILGAIAEGGFVVSARCEGGKAFAVTFDANRRPDKVIPCWIFEASTKLMCFD